MSIAGNPALIIEALVDTTRLPSGMAQAEAIVEGLQAQLWSGAFDEQAFLAGAASACTARDKQPFDFGKIGIDIKAALYDRALSLNEKWISAPYFSTLSLEFSPQPV